MREAGVKERGARKTIRIVPQATAAQAGVDPRARGEPELALLRHQEDPARAEAAHRVRGSVLPQHRRVLRQRHGHLHDPRRHLHAPLSVLRRGPRPAAARRMRRSRAHLAETIALLELELRGDYERRPRRPARRRRTAFRRLHLGRARAFTADHDRSAGAGFPRPAGSRARGPQGGAAGRDEPQPRDRAAALPQGAPGRRLCALAAPAAGIQEAASRRCRPSRA